MVNQEKGFMWCSAHQPTTEQMVELLESGKVTFLKDVAPELQQKINNCPPDRDVLSGMAKDLLSFTEDYTLVQVGGSPMFLYVLGSVVGAHLSKRAMLFAYTKRISEDVPQKDGSIKKTSIFKHEGFY